MSKKAAEILGVDRYLNDYDLEDILDPLTRLLHNSHAGGVQAERARSAKLIEALSATRSMDSFQYSKIWDIIGKAIAEFEASK